MSKAHNAAKAAFVHLDEPFPLHPGSVFDCADDNNDGQLEQICKQQDLNI